MLLLAIACAGPEPVAELVFVRGGVLISGEGEGRTFVAREWSPGEAVEVGDLAAVAPERPDCVSLWSVPLGDVSRLVAQGGDAPDTALAWSPDGSRLAVGSYRGEVLVLDGWTGEVHARRHLPEAMAKQVAWAPGGGALYVGEQSAEGRVRALDPATLATRWEFALSQEVGTSTPPAGHDLYGVYTLPGAYGLHVGADGSILVAAVHGWNDESGARRNRSRLLRLSAGGDRLGAWPADGPADATLMNPRVDEGSGLVVVPVGRSAEGPVPDLPVGGVAVLAWPDLREVASVVVPPLPPYFARAFVWEAAAVDGNALLLGLGDGRVFLYAIDRAIGAVEERAALSTGAPVMAGEVPVVASVGFGLLRDGAAFFTTAGTNIPYGAASPDLRPPSAHPGENALWAVDLDGKPLWTFRGPWRLGGLAEGGGALVVSAGERVSDERRDLYGALVVDPVGGHLAASCATEGPVFFRMAAHKDGRIALAEYPYRRPDGTLGGEYRVTVVR